MTFLRGMVKRQVRHFDNGRWGIWLAFRVELIVDTCSICYLESDVTDNLISSRDTNDIFLACFASIEIESYLEQLCHLFQKFFEGRFSRLSKKIRLVYFELAMRGTKTSRLIWSRI